MRSNSGPSDPPLWLPDIKEYLRACAKLDLMLRCSNPEPQPDADVLQLVTRRTKIRIGTAGWANPPGERQHRKAAHSHLDHYARRFNAVEINSTFYRSHRAATYQCWRDSTPDDFAFAVKMSRTITHESGLHDCRRELRNFLHEVSALGAKLRVILIQLPPGLAFETRAATRFFASIPSKLPYELACEPRHSSWFSPAVDDFLRRRGVSRVAADPTRDPGGMRPGGRRRLAYYRLHGSPRIYYSAYETSFLTDLAGQIRTGGARVRETWCIFENTARYEAWNDARRLQRMWKSHLNVS